ncbi:L-threonylcarbamoyladenylate synthase type 1 TsaC [Alteromonas aestuariivivens]|uniref:Threonylcarbamoyl-AMP synthase n=1 Tax=Alteromonas aestuariivivens TaxID=1938339 RepID=A0A3D8M545_9ALTE|nr:Sua5/YciO/YrdC/YwlC family protein [Alteromonas aestuariivivens]RDV24751.1 L-threonylcarbamoyladenylate synthase type 1 TsaC [Alteromonas aestuariivivens]
MQDTQNTLQLAPEVEAFRAGKLLVYPTEAVMGIGCDPDNEVAVQALLNLKGRAKEKGVILIADTYSRLLPYVDDKAIRQDRRTEIFSSWPGPVTWLLPKSAGAPDWITGGNPSIAVRVTAHPVVRALCEKVGMPLVSTSANPSGKEPAINLQQAREYFGDSVCYVAGEVGERSRPSTIRDGQTGQIIRA